MRRAATPGRRSGLTVEATRSSRPTRRGSSGRSHGLTLLEAAAVGGEPLAVEALASALGQVFRGARRRPGRVAVAMSGGVDSAVALHRAGPGRDRRHAPALAGPGGAGHRARVLLAGRGVCGARATCHALGRPHVTLDLREEFKGVIVDPFTQAYAARRDAESVHALQRRVSLRRSRGIRERAGADELWTGHYARIVERDGMRLVARGADHRKDQSYMLAAVDPALLERVRFPLGEQTKAETRAEAAAAGLAAARRAESQEACFLGGDDYRAFLERQGLQRDGRRRSWTWTARRWASTTATGGSRPASDAACASPATARSSSCGRTRRPTPSRSARASGSP